MQTASINRLPTYFIAACVALTGCSSDRTNSVAPANRATTSTAAESATSPSSPELATTLPVPTSGPTTTPATTSPESSTTTVALTSEPADDDPTAWDDGSEEGDPEVSAAPGVCEPFYDAIAGGPYTVQRCGIWNAIGGQRMWTVTKGATDRFLAIVWQQIAPNAWVPVLRALEEAPGVWSDFTIRTGNIDAGSNDELVSGVRIAGTGGFLDVSVVDIRSGSPRVMAVLNGNTKGTAVMRAGGGVEIWSGVFADTDPGCCPGNFVQQFLVADGGDWLLASGATLPGGDPGIPITEF